MPFTLAHPAAVLPLGGTGLPLAPLVLGSMAPDVPLFVPWPVGYGVTHSLLGVVTADLALALALSGLGVLLLHEALVDLAPAQLRARLPRTVDYPRSAWLAAPVAAVVGSLTHVVWDDFTHPGRWGVRHVGWLHTEHGGLVGHQWAQYASGVVGLAVVGGWAVTRLRRRPVRPRAATVPALAPAALLGVLAAVVVTSALAAVLSWPAGLHAAAYRAAVSGTVVLAGGLLLASAAWHLLARRARSTPVPGR